MNDAPRANVDAVVAEAHARQRRAHGENVIAAAKVPLQRTDVVAESPVAEEVLLRIALQVAVDAAKQPHRRIWVDAPLTLCHFRGQHPQRRARLVLPVLQS